MENLKANQNPTNPRSYWFVGAVYNGTDDQTERFLKDKIWENGYENKYQDLVLGMKSGDRIAIKASYVPEYPRELTGHADGLVRFIDEDTVFINETEGEPEKEWLRNFLKILNENQLLHIKLPCPVASNQENANGLYLNYLQVGDLIVVPQFKMKEDERALKIFDELLGSKYTIVLFDARWIAKHGGVLNCATWP